MSAPARLRSRLRGVVSLGTFVAVVVAVGVSVLYLAWVATIRNSDQIGELSVGTFVVGLACAFGILNAMWLELDDDDDHRNTDFHRR